MSYWGALFIVLEVKQTQNGMPPNKLPSIDGMNRAFYQRFWNIFGAEVTKECLHILNSYEMPSGLNNTVLVLIPKKAKPESMGNLYLISL